MFLHAVLLFSLLRPSQRCCRAERLVHRNEEEQSLSPNRSIDEATNRLAIRLQSVQPAGSACEAPRALRNMQRG